MRTFRGLDASAAGGRRCRPLLLRLLFLLLVQAGRAATAGRGGGADGRGGQPLRPGGRRGWRLADAVHGAGRGRGGAGGRHRGPASAGSHAGGHAGGRAGGRARGAAGRLDRWGGRRRGRGADPGPRPGERGTPGGGRAGRGRRLLNGHRVGLVEADSHLAAVGIAVEARRGPSLGEVRRPVLLLLDELSAVKLALRFLGLLWPPSCGCWVRGLRRLVAVLGGALPALLLVDAVGGPRVRLRLRGRGRARRAVPRDGGRLLRRLLLGRGHGGVDHPGRHVRVVVVVVQAAVGLGGVPVGVRPVARRPVDDPRVALGALLRHRGRRPGPLVPMAGPARGGVAARGLDGRRARRRRRVVVIVVVGFGLLAGSVVVA